MDIVYYSHSDGYCLCPACADFGAMVDDGNETGFVFPSFSCEENLEDVVCDHCNEIIIEGSHYPYCYLVTYRTEEEAEEARDWIEVSDIEDLQVKGKTVLFRTKRKLESEFSSRLHAETHVKKFFMIERHA